jgi:poly(hydroxyalkanoate) depolymerase family esterase
VITNFMGTMRRAGTALRHCKLGEAASALRDMLDRRRNGGERDETSGGLSAEDAQVPVALGRSSTAGRDPRLAGSAESAGEWKTAHEAGADVPRAHRSLREAFRLLRDGRSALQAAVRRREPGLDLPEGAELHHRQFACQAGERAYRLFVPSLGARGPSGLILMLHGCSQTPEEFAAGTGMNALAQDLGLIVAYPQQTSEHSALSCWNWFRPLNQIRGSGEPAILAGLAEHLREEFHLPRNRVFAAGLSAGGAMAAILADAYPERFEAVGIHSGIAPGSARGVLSAIAAMRGKSFNGVNWRLQTQGARAPRIIVFHGEADRMVHPSNADRIIGSVRAHFPDSEARMETGLSPGGRAYRRMLQADPEGTPLVEVWMVEGVGHAWSGGAADTPHTDPCGPNASREMVRFFLAPGGLGSRA